MSAEPAATKTAPQPAAVTSPTGTKPNALKSPTSATKPRSGASVKFKKAAQKLQGKPSLRLIRRARSRLNLDDHLSPKSSSPSRKSQLTDAFVDASKDKLTQSFLLREEDGEYALPKQSKYTSTQAVEEAEEAKRLRMQHRAALRPQILYFKFTDFERQNWLQEAACEKKYSYIQIAEPHFRHFIYHEREWEFLSCTFFFEEFSQRMWLIQRNLARRLQIASDYQSFLDRVMPSVLLSTASTCTVFRPFHSDTVAGSPTTILRTSGLEKTLESVRFPVTKSISRVVFFDAQTRNHTLAADIFLRAQSTLFTVFHEKFGEDLLSASRQRYAFLFSHLIILQDNERKCRESIFWKYRLSRVPLQHLGAHLLILHLELTERGAIAHKFQRIKQAILHQEKTAKEEERKEQPSGSSAVSPSPRHKDANNASVFGSGSSPSGAYGMKGGAFSRLSAALVYRAAAIEEVEEEDMNAEPGARSAQIEEAKRQQRLAENVVSAFVTVSTVLSSPERAAHSTDSMRSPLTQSLGRLLLQGRSATTNKMAAAEKNQQHQQELRDYYFSELSTTEAQIKREERSSNNGRKGDVRRPLYDHEPLLPDNSVKDKNTAMYGDNSVSVPPENVEEIEMCAGLLLLLHEKEKREIESAEQSEWQAIVRVHNKDVRRQVREEVKIQTQVRLTFLQQMEEEDRTQHFKDFLCGLVEVEECIFRMKIRSEENKLYKMIFSQAMKEARQRLAMSEVHHLTRAQNLLISQHRSLQREMLTEHELYLLSEVLLSLSIVTLKTEERKAFWVIQRAYLKESTVMRRVLGLPPLSAEDRLSPQRVAAPPTTSPTKESVKEDGAEPDEHSHDVQKYFASIPVHMKAEALASLEHYKRRQIFIEASYEENEIMLVHFLEPLIRTQISDSFFHSFGKMFPVGYLNLLRLFEDPGFQGSEQYQRSLILFDEGMERIVWKAIDFEPKLMKLQEKLEFNSMQAKFLKGRNQRLTAQKRWEEKAEKIWRTMLAEERTALEDSEVGARLTLEFTESIERSGVLVQTLLEPSRRDSLVSAFETETQQLWLWLGATAEADELYSLLQREKCELWMEFLISTMKLKEEFERGAILAQLVTEDRVLYVAFRKEKRQRQVAIQRAASANQRGQRRREVTDFLKRYAEAQQQFFTEHERTIFSIVAESELCREVWMDESRSRRMITVTCMKERRQRLKREERQNDDVGRARE